MDPLPYQIALFNKIFTVTIKKICSTNKTAWALAFHYEGSFLWVSTAIFYG